RAFRSVAFVSFAIPFVVHVEAAVEAESGVERESADEGAGAVAGRLEEHRKSRNLLTEAKQSVGADAMRRRRDAREDRRVRRQRQRRAGVGAGETNALAGDPIERWCQPRPTAEGADPVAPQRVDGDQQEVAADARAGLYGVRRQASPCQPASQRKSE